MEPRKSKTSVPVNNYKVIKSVTANNSEPSQSRGSIVSNVPSSSLDECRSSKLSSGTVKVGNVSCARIMGMGAIDWECYNFKGLLRLNGWDNLFYVGQFVDSNSNLRFVNTLAYIRNLEGVDLLTRLRGSSLYISPWGYDDVLPICLLQGL
ncbi:hypothetical protein Tco_0270034 [Tanacetum coccineum]